MYRDVSVGRKGCTNIVESVVADDGGNCSMGPHFCGRLRSKQDTVLCDNEAVKDQHEHCTVFNGVKWLLGPM
jgi:hypothetical protein